MGGGHNCICRSYVFDDWNNATAQAYADDFPLTAEQTKVNTPALEVRMSKAGAAVICLALAIMLSPR